MQSGFPQLPEATFIIIYDTLVNDGPLSLKNLNAILRKLHGRFSSQLKLTRSHPKDVLFWFFFELWDQLLHLTAWSQPGGGHLRHIPLQPPYRDPCATSAGPPISRSFSELQEGARTGPKMGLRRDRKRTPKGSSKSALKAGFQEVVFRKVLQHRIASYRVALHRIASR